MRHSQATRVRKDIDHSAADENSLLQYMLNDYSRSVRPVLNASDAVPVKFSLYLLRIDDLDLKNQALSTFVWLRHEWKDQLLTWDPSDFNDIRSISIPNEHIWLPDIVLYNRYVMKK